MTGPVSKPCFDFTGSGRTSFATTTGNGITSSPIVWHILDNGGDGSSQIFAFGRGGLESRDGLAPGYYDADNRADAAVVRRASFTGGQITYYIRPSTLTDKNPNAYYTVDWGLFPQDLSDKIGDYDGDGRDDITAARNENGARVWWILRSSTNTFNVVTFGLSSDVVMPGADYNGDGRDELTVIRIYSTTPARSSTYFAGDSNTGALVQAQDWGDGGNKDNYIIGDYLGDQRADFAVMRVENAGVDAFNATWWILENGGTGQVEIRTFGYGEAGPTVDLPVCGDYNGDGKQDIAVYRVAEDTFYWLNSPDFTAFSYQSWGTPGVLDFPVGSLHTHRR